ncbi:LacI family DNA-binding transcriptional regulator [Roseobacter sp. YSTF-M11]|uniref:LacI family DNA-binding transcriptional regulator n=1 Tax=Roseobacter insulae TaxID=2859783 RepID=A0A9X1JZT6_9RHOB|nr:LacI family DNA-binding transcriptional regulator [Roseobacter insulae]MBW4709741.1 LacI family DNA-binding transcriptional regulator [Roseobacter insulae]
MHKKRITLADVAARAGVSQMTASKVLRGTGSISEETRKRVKLAASDLGYVPNLFAGSLSSRSSNIVAVVLPSINDAVFGEVVAGINDVLRPEGYVTFIGESHLNPQTEETIIQTVLSMQPAGIILTGGIHRTAKADQLLESWACPIIQIWDEEDEHYDGCVAPDHANAGRLTAQHFIDRGVKQPAYIGAELGKDICAARRFETFRQTIIEAGLDLVEVIAEDLPRQPGTGRTLVADLMQTHPHTDAIYFLNDAMATGGLSWLHETSYHVPEQVAVAAFNGTSLAHAVRTRLTTVHVERLKLGEVAARALLQSIDTRSAEKIREIFYLELSRGNTS